MPRISITSNHHTPPDLDILSTGGRPMEGKKTDAKWGCRVIGGKYVFPKLLLKIRPGWSRKKIAVKIVFGRYKNLDFWKGISRQIWGNNLFSAVEKQWMALKGKIPFLETTRTFSKTIIFTFYVYLWIDQKCWIEIRWFVSKFQRKTIFCLLPALIVRGSASGFFPQRGSGMKWAV